jgi:cell division septation protein DedD
MTAQKLFAILAAGSILTGCQDLEGFSFLQPGEDAAGEAPIEGRSTKLIERDVEAPEVFSATEAGLWDGRPSLGGVWVAHPGVKDPERVIIRNATNDKFVIGALFRRERDNPGPRLQVSSDAAAALGMLAGQPVELNVTALRREEVPEEPVAVEADAIAAEDIAETTLDPIESAAAAAITAAEAQPEAPAPKPAPASTLKKPYIQIGIFRIESNADNTANRMRKAGMVPVVKKQSSKGKTFWRVLVGPATTSAERSALLKKIKAEGFADAYAVTN